MQIFEAIAFVVLWASASVATKIGLASGPPLVLATLRFFLAGGLLLAGLVASRRPVWPGRHSGPIALLGLLNTSVYLGASFIALSVVPAGLFNLFVTVNPFLALILSRLWLKTTVKGSQWLGFVISSTGLFVGSWASMENTRVPLWGIGLILLGMMSMAAGSLYFQKVQIPLDGVVINMWQLLFGAVFLLPVTAIMSIGRPVIWNLAWWGSLAWLVGAVSIGAMILWFHLLRLGAARASVWLLLTPIVGYVLAAVFLHEPLTLADGAASLLVIGGLALSEYAGRSAMRSSDHVVVRDQ